MGRDAQRLQQSEIHHIGAQRDGLALHLVGRAGVVAERRHHAIDIAERIPERLADIQSLEPGQLLAMGHNGIGEPEEERPALRRRQARPGPLHCGMGRLDGEVDIRRSAAGDLGQGLLRCRIHGREMRPAGGVDPTAIDEQPVTHDIS